MRWQLTPDGSEGWRKAEEMRGGVDTRELSSQTMESRLRPGLYFIGEVVDVTGCSAATTSSGPGPARRPARVPWRKTWQTLDLQAILAVLLANLRVDSKQSSGTFANLQILQLLQSPAFNGE